MLKRGRFFFSCVYLEKKICYFKGVWEGKDRSYVDDWILGELLIYDFKEIF